MRIRIISAEANNSRFPVRTAPARSMVETVTVFKAPVSAPISLKVKHAVHAVMTLRPLSRYITHLL